MQTRIIAIPFLLHQRFVGVDVKYQITFVPTPPEKQPVRIVQEAR
jgi:hypothetical protein